MSSFKINEAYANKYNRWRGLEELQKSINSINYLFLLIYYHYIINIWISYFILTVADKRKREGIESTDEEEDTEDESSSSEESVCLVLQYFFHMLVFLFKFCFSLERRNFTRT